MSRRRLLIAEDDQIAQLYLKLLLENSGYDIVDTADSGDSVIEKALKFKPDLILMDIFLENQTDGIEAVKKIRKSVIIPVVYITANTDEGTRIRAADTEPAAVINKPYSDSFLLSVLETVFRKLGKISC